MRHGKAYHWLHGFIRRHNIARRVLIVIFLIPSLVVLQTADAIVAGFMEFWETALTNADESWREIKGGW